MSLILCAATAAWAAVATTTATVYHRRLHTDPLTRISNHAALHRRARPRIRRSGIVGLLVADLDRFKSINDTYGHPFGDRVLAAVAARLRDLARPGELPARLHGDEFALWLGHLDDAEQAERRADDLFRALSAPLSIGDHRIAAGGSVGHAVAPTGTPLDELISQADAHLYLAKARTRQPRDLARAQRRPGVVAHHHLHAGACGAGEQ
ncbi:GGDEF domain-containing protein [Saccharopolyspora taberi]|uniref:GGDEF domain-containing protein n=1 Tax=Saccharopolyspora taberi TaxID=60895 RepID=A0ABN3VAY2_9PSEU